jgi:hypothetical protein
VAELNDSDLVDLIPQDIVLVYRPGPWLRTAQACVVAVTSATFLYVCGRFVGLASYFAVVPAVALALVAARFLPPPHRVVVTRDSVRVGRRTIPFASIDRVARPPLSFAAGQVTLNLVIPKTPTLGWHLFGVSSVPLRGDTPFIAHVIEAMHRRAPILAVEAGVYEVIGDRGSSERSLRIVTVIAFALLGTSWLFIMGVSIAQFATPVAFLVLPLGLSLATGSARVLDRDAPQKAVLMAYLAGATPLVLALWAVALLEGVTRLLPVVYALAASSSFAGVAAMIRVRPLKTYVYGIVGVGVAAFMGVVALFTSLGTLPVDIVRSWPPTDRAVVSPDGLAVLLESPYLERRVAATVDVKSLEVREVSAGSRYQSVLALHDAQNGVFLRRGFSTSIAVAAGSVSGSSEDLYTVDGGTFFSPVASTEAGRAALFVAEGEPAPVPEGIAPQTGGPDARRAKRLIVVDLQTRTVTITNALTAPGAAVSAAWGTDGRLRWAEHAQVEHPAAGTPAVWTGGRLIVRSWAGEDEEPAVEYESADEVRAYSHSPRFDVLRVEAAPGTGQPSTLVRLRDKRSTDIRDPIASDAWSADGGVYVYTIAGERGAALAIDTWTMTTRVIHYPGFGHCAWASVSPDGKRGAVCVEETSSVTMAVYLVDMTSLEARRLRPIVSSAGSLGRVGASGVSWSADGRVLAIPTYYNPLATALPQRIGEVWILRL